MKVRILSGNQAGQIVEQTPDEAGNNIAMGFAELVKDEPVEPAAAKPPVVAEPQPEPEPDPAPVEAPAKPEPAKAPTKTQPRKVKR